MRLVLASKSERRMQLLSEMGFEFEVVPADVDETPPDGLDAHQVSRALAGRKARAVAKRFDDAIVIGADTICAIDDEIIGKPVDDADAVSILRRLSGRSQSVITGLCIIDTAHGREQIDSDETVIRMLPMSDRQIEEYIASGRAYGRAGAYGYEGEDDPYVDEFEGSGSNILGLPVELLRRMLARWGIPVEGPGTIGR